MGRPPCCDKSNVKRGLWTADEDAKILAYVANHGIGNWTLVPQKAGLNRCGKSCRLRWTNYLKPDLRHDHFTPEEEQLILDYHKAIGSRWSLIAKQLPGRTDNDVKNHWNTKLKKKLSKMGIDPVTHKPFSQIISDYGKITRLPNTGKQTGSNAISMNTIPIPISEPTFPYPFPDPFQDKSFPHTINQETIQSHIFAAEVSSSSTSSSSSCSIAQSSSRRSFSCLASPAPATAPSSPSSWSAEFLLGEPVPSPEVDRKQDLDLQEMLSLAFLPKLSGGDEEKFSGVAGEKACEEINNGVETKQCSDQAGSSSANSFVEAILDRDSEMRLEFPEFLNDYFSY